MVKDEAVRKISARIREECYLAKGNLSLIERNVKFYKDGQNGENGKAVAPLVVQVKCNVGEDATGQKKEMLAVKEAGKKSKAVTFCLLSGAKMSPQLTNWQMMVQIALVNGSLESGPSGQILMKSS